MASAVWIALVLLLASATLYFKQLDTANLAAKLSLMSATSTIRDAAWQDAAHKKVQENLAKIPRDWLLSASVLDQAKSRRKIAGEFIEGLLDESTRAITQLDASALLQGMAEGSLSAVQVVVAFCKRAAYAHQLVCIDSCCREQG